MASPNTITDGDFTVASAVTDPHIAAAFEGDPGRYVLEQEFVINNDYFAALPLSTPHPTFTNYFLVDESVPVPQSVPGIVHWKRTYAQVPAPRNDYGSIAYSFIGYYGKIANLAIASTFPIRGRNRFTETVTCRVQNDYFLVGTSPAASYATAALIPSIREQKYYIPLGTISGSTFTRTYTAGSDNDINYGTATDSIWNAADWASLIPTTPTLSDYQAAIVASSEIVAEPSQLTRWKGNIYVRVTKYIVAQ